MSDHSEDTVEALAEKLASLDLTEGEAAALCALLDACDSEVAGFGGRTQILIDFTGAGAKFDARTLADGLHRALGSTASRRGILPTGETA